MPTFIDSRIVLALALVSSAATSCALAPGESTQSSDQALLYIGPPPKINVCGAPNGYAYTDIVSFTAGATASPSAVYGEPIRYHWTLLMNDPPSGYDPPIAGVALDGVAVPQYDLNAADPSHPFGGFTTSAPLDASTPLTHTLSFSGPCGTKTKTITITPYQPTVPQFDFTISPAQITRGQTATVAWNLQSFPVLPSDCSPFDQRLDWSLASSGQPLGGESIYLDDWMPTSPSDSVDFTMTLTCATHPGLARSVTHRLTVTPPPPGTPQITSFTVAPDNGYVYAGTPATFAWSTSFPNCERPSVALVGTSFDRPGEVDFQSSGLPQAGSLAVVPSEPGSYRLAATCGDDGVTTWSNALNVTLYNPLPKPPNGQFYCFEVVGAASGCTAVTIYSDSASDAEAAVDATYPAYAGWQTSEITPCNGTTLAQACPL